MNNSQPLPFFPLQFLQYRECDAFAFQKLIHCSCCLRFCARFVCFTCLLLHLQREDERKQLGIMHFIYYNAVLLYTYKLRLLLPCISEVLSRNKTMSQELPKHHHRRRTEAARFPRKEPSHLPRQPGSATDRSQDSGICCLVRDAVPTELDYFDQSPWSIRHAILRNVNFTYPTAYLRRLRPHHRHWSTMEVLEVLLRQE